MKMLVLIQMVLLVLACAVEELQPHAAASGEQRIESSR